MKRSLWFIVLVVVLSAPEARAAGPARVVIRDAVTGTVQKSQWMDMAEAIKIGMNALGDRTIQDCWIEEKRRLLFFVPLPSHRITVFRTRTVPAPTVQKKESFRTPFSFLPGGRINPQ